MSRCLLATLLALSLLMSGCDSPKDTSVVVQPVASDAATSTKPIESVEASSTPRKDRRTRVEKLTKRNFAKGLIAAPPSWDLRNGVVTQVDGRNLTVLGARGDSPVMPGRPKPFRFYAVSDFPGVRVGDRFWFYRANDGEYHISTKKNRLKGLE